MKVVRLSFSTSMTFLSFITYESIPFLKFVLLFISMREASYALGNMEGFLKYVKSLFSFWMSLINWVAILSSWTEAEPPWFYC